MAEQKLRDSMNDLGGRLDPPRGRHGLGCNHVHVRALHKRHKKEWDASFHYT